MNVAKEPMKITILIVDDDPVIRKVLSVSLQKEGYATCEAESAERALELITQYTPDLALLDISMEGISGIELAQRLRQETTIPFMFVTQHGGSEFVTRAVLEGAVGYLVKPIDMAVVIPAIKVGLARAQEIHKLREYDAVLNSSLKDGYHTGFDPLTGLANRERLQDRLHHAMLLAARYRRQVAVALIGLDHFKSVNKRFGHDVGDQLLKSVAERLKSHLRASDTLARLESDEFIVVIDHADQRGMSGLMSKILELIAQPIQLRDATVQVTCSIGLSLYPADGEDVVTLLKNAHAALVLAKDQGRNNIQYCTQEMTQKVAKRLTLDANLRNALDRNEFLLYYQPQVSLQSGQIIGVEALIRWNHPTTGMISPADFVPVAEELGLIVPIGEWVLRTACAQNMAWQKAGLPKIRMGVNLSAGQFRNNNMIDVLAKILVETGLAARHLDLELTESMAMQNVESTISTLTQLKEMGVRLSIDDFGTGYSSLSYLKRFPIDVLKIDQSFVRDITTNADDAAIARAIISLAHSMDLEVIAEGVESESQLRYLKRHYCDEMQGYYFSRPVMADECAMYLAQGKSLAMPSSDTSTMKQTLLIVDDDHRIIKALQRLLRRENYRILTATSPEQGFELLALHDVQVILCDQVMPNMSGTEFLARVKDLHPDTIRMILTGRADLHAAIDAINRGAVYRFLTKPWDEDVLPESIRAAFQHYWLVHDEKMLTT